MLWNPVPVHLRRNGQVRGRLWDAWPQSHVRTTLIITAHPLVQETLQVVRCCTVHGALGCAVTIDVQDATGGMFDDHKHIQAPKGCGHYHAEVTRDDHLSMITHKGPPALGESAWPRGTVSGHWYVLPHGTRRDTYAELEQQFVGNPLLAPQRVLPGYPADERLQVCRDSGPSRVGFPPPEQPDPLAMPADQRRRLSHGQYLPPIEPAGEPDQGHPGGVGGGSLPIVAAGRRDV